MATERAVVPAIWPLEVANVLLMGKGRKRSTQAKATKCLRFLTALPITIDTDTPFRAFDSMLDLARLHRLTAYDTAYFELAIRLGLPLATLDGDIGKAATASGVPIYTPQHQSTA